MNPVKLPLAMGIAVLITACGPSEDVEETVAPVTQEEDAATAEVTCPQPDDSGVIVIQEGLKATILKRGYGRAAQSKDYVDVHAKLWIYDEEADGGRGAKIWESGGIDPFQFQLDTGQVIPGFDLGIECMLIGEKRELIIPPELGYGDRSQGPIPAGSTLFYELELVQLAAPE